jgi:hypothetical protein
MAYATAEELRAQFNKTSTAKDVTLTALLSAAELTINHFCNRPDGFEADTATSTRIYAGSGKPYQFIDETVEITLVEVKDSPTDTSYTSWAATDWIGFKGDPRDPNYNSLPYDSLMVDPTGDYAVFLSGSYVTRGGFRPSTDVPRGVPTVRVTAKWGYSVAVPADIKEACIMQAARWFKRLEGAMSDALSSGELGVLLYQQALDPAIKLILVNGRHVKPMTGRR